MINFSKEMDHVRKLWGIRQGATIMLIGKSEPELHVIGNEGWLMKHSNDNEAGK